MFPYIIVLVLVSFWILLEHIYLKRKAFFIPLLFLCLFPAIRSDKVGSDSHVYTSLFESQFNIENYIFNYDIELGYQLFEFILLNFTKNYFWLFFISSFLIVSLYLNTIRKLSIHYFLSVFIFITFGFYTFFFNGLRQGIAMAICFFCLSYLIEKRIFSYTIFVFLASMFHISALVMFPMYFLVNSRFRIEYKVFGCFLFSLSVSQILVNYLASGNIRYEHYAKTVEKPGGYITLLFYSLIGFIIIFFGSKYRNFDIRFNKFEQIYLCGLALVIPISLLGTDPSGPQRVLYYFTGVVVFLFPYILKFISNIYLNFLFIVFSVIYFILITMSFSNLYPYQINPIFELF